MDGGLRARSHRHVEDEDLILELKKEFTIVIVTHNMQQAARISDDTAFSTSANWWNSAAPEKFSPTRRKNARKIT